MSSLTWAEIDAIGQSGAASSAFSIGDTKNISVSGETLTMEIVGFNHDDLASGGKAAYTFGMKNLMATKRQMHNFNAQSAIFVETALYGWLSGDLYDSLPQDLKPVIKTVNKKTRTSSDIATIRTDEMKLFLFSGLEVGHPDESVGQGNQYEKFTSNKDRIKKLNNGNGSADSWWTRSPRPLSNRNTQYGLVSATGNPVAIEVSALKGVCFGFCV